MNLDRARLLLSKLSIKHRDLNVSVPFILNNNQLICHNAVRKFYAQHGNVRAICLKARRVGMSSYFDSVLFCHSLARPQAHAEIVAHLKDVSTKGLFRVPRDLASELNSKIGGDPCEIFAQQIKFHHQDGDSLLDIATAGSVGGGRGLTLTALHLSEAALYPGQDSFLSILPAVSKAPDTIIAIESTAQGRTGIGQTFFDHWTSAKKVGRQWNGYLPIFLSWLDDPACWSDSPAKDAPATDLERELMGKPYFATREQIAWMRFVLEGECAASEAKFSQEYPWTPEVAFTSTGDPAFAPAEIKYAYKTRKEKPLIKGTFFRDSGTVKLREDKAGKWFIYERAIPKCHYYCGVDCARGMEFETGRATGDFSAIGIINGTTGDASAKFSEWVDPDMIANEVDMAGRYYNKAKVNVELTGNLGWMAQKRLRDDFMYPNFYIWKGKDDKQVGKQMSHALGWETQGRSRDILYQALRGKLRDGMKNIPGGFAPIDPELIEQMDVATLSTGGRWEVEKGHDDVLVCFMLAVVACVQYPPPMVWPSSHNVYETPKEKTDSVASALKASPDLVHALQRDLRFVFRKEKQQIKAVRGGY